MAMRFKILGKNSGNLILFILIVVGYFFFLSSRLWLPDARKLIESTPFFERQILNDYGVYLTKWDYAEEQQVMELIVEIETKDLLSDELECEAFERKAGKLNTEIVVKDREYLIIRIIDIPEKWKEISVHLKNQKSDSLNLYTNLKKVNKVATLDKKSKPEYEIDRLKGQIDYDTYLINKKEKDVSVLEKENLQLKIGIEEMEEKTYPTQEEANRAAELIESAETKYKTNEDTMENSRKEIAELEARTEELKKQIESLML